MTEVFPKRMPPLRSDRETIVLGTLKGKDPLNLKLDVAGAAGPEKIAMTVSPGASDERNTYLAQLVELRPARWRRDVAAGRLGEP